MNSILLLYFVCLSSMNFVYAEVLQLNIDHFDKYTMTQILSKHGSFELIGPSVDALSTTAVEALQDCKTLLDLPLETLEHWPNKDFSGFQNVYQKTYDEFVAGINPGPIRNQIAYHYKPYRLFTVPGEKLDQHYINHYPIYYYRALSLLNRLYDKIAEHYIDPKLKTTFNPKDERSALSSRKYFPGGMNETGIPAHSDYGLLTLVISDQDGLEILEGENARTGRWLKTSHGEPNKPRFYVNIGDWLLFQTGNKEFVAGVHRVPTVTETRYSIAVFLNPPLKQELLTFSGVSVEYGTFLGSPNKKPYHLYPRWD